MPGLLRLKVRLEGSPDSGKLVGCDPSTTTLEELQTQIATKLLGSSAATTARGKICLEDGRYEIEDLFLLDDWQEIVFVPDASNDSNNSNSNDNSNNNGGGGGRETIDLSSRASNGTQQPSIKQEAIGEERPESSRRSKAKKKHSKKSKKTQVRRGAKRQGRKGASSVVSRTTSHSDSEDEASREEENLSNQSDDADDDQAQLQGRAKPAVNTRSKQVKRGRLTEVERLEASHFPDNTSPEKYYAKHTDGVCYPVTLIQVLGTKASVTWHGYGRCKQQVNVKDLIPWSPALENAYSRLRRESKAMDTHVKAHQAVRKEKLKKRKLEKKAEEKEDAKRQKQQEQKQAKAALDEMWGPKLKNNDLSQYSADVEETSIRDFENQRRIYFCKGDETVEQISQRFGIEVEKIMYQNDHHKKLTRKKKLKPKSIFVIPMRPVFGIKGTGPQLDETDDDSDESEDDDDDDVEEEEQIPYYSRVTDVVEVPTLAPVAAETPVVTDGPATVGPATVGPATVGSATDAPATDAPETSPPDGSLNDECTTAVVDRKIPQSEEEDDEYDGEDENIPEAVGSYSQIFVI